jgi:hypothetical protein
MWAATFWKFENGRSARVGALWQELQYMEKTWPPVSESS